MNNSQLNEIARTFNIPNYIGSFPCNKIPVMCCSNRYCYILNTKPKNHSGEHWLAVKINSNKRTIKFFDSYGDPPEGCVLNSLQKVYPNYSIVFNTKELQKMDDTCGLWCLWFLWNNKMEIPEKKLKEFFM
jgi:hypothetical protein